MSVSVSVYTQPGGHLFLSTISRTPLAHLLTVTLAEDVLRLVSPGTHHSSKFVKPAELDAFFDSLPGWSSSELDAKGGNAATGREARGVIYKPWKGEWDLVSKGMGEWGRVVNYVYSVRRPRE